MAYFTYFPIIDYDVRGIKNDSNIQRITDILKRVRKKLEIINLAFFEEYFVRTPARNVLKPNSSLY